MKIKKIEWLVYVISFVLLILIVLKLIEYFKSNGSELSCIDAQEIEFPINEDEFDIVYGKQNAPLAVFMYTSYNCDYCTQFFTENYPKLKNDFINKGKVKLVIKYVELGHNQDVLFSLQAAICVNKFGNFEKFHELMLSDNRVVYSKEFKDLINDIIGNNKDLNECITDHNDYNYLMNNNKEFEQHGLTGTPTFIINGHIYRGFIKYKKFKAILKTELRNI